MSLSYDLYGYIYYLLLAHYRSEISEGYLSLPINGEVSLNQVKLVDSTTLTRFTDVFKGAGRNPISGKKKGGLKGACSSSAGQFGTRIGVADSSQHQ